MIHFREFYLEVIRQKSLIQKSIPKISSETSSTKDDAETMGESDVQSLTKDNTKATVESVGQSLMALLNKQIVVANKLGGDYVMETYKEAQFIMAALADEIFLHMEWEGKDLWQSNLLETKLFGSHAAGETFFQKLDRVLQNRDPVYKELAEVFLITLALGFQGKYRGETNRGWLEFYRKELFRFIFQKEPDIAVESSRLFFQAYAHQVEEGSGLTLPNPRRWVIISVAVTIGLVFISHLIWIDVVKDLERVVNQILLGT